MEENIRLLEHVYALYPKYIREMVNSLAGKPVLGI
jgi:hypothetical protein